MKIKNIGIIGVGVVGSAVKFGLEQLGHKVKIHDTKLDTNIENILDCEICYICVPTPSNKEGECDITIVKSVIDELTNNQYKGIIAIKSTIIPGTTEKFIEKYKNDKICFVPEFLRERCAISDFCENHDLCVIGTENNEIYKIIKNSHGKYPEKFIQLSPTEAELTKYFNNTFFACLITFANSFYEICGGLNIDYNKVKEAIVNRKFISDYYLDCNNNLRGFGGVCLPKDTKALDSLSKKLELNVEFFKNITTENEKYKTTIFKGMRK